MLTSAFPDVPPVDLYVYFEVLATVAIFQVFVDLLVSLKENLCTDRWNFRERNPRAEPPVTGAFVVRIEAPRRRTEKRGISLKATRMREGRRASVTQNSRYFWKDFDIHSSYFGEFDAFIAFFRDRMCWRIYLRTLGIMNVFGWSERWQIFIFKLGECDSDYQYGSVESLLEHCD